MGSRPQSQYCWRWAGVHRTQCPQGKRGLCCCLRPPLPLNLCQHPNAAKHKCLVRWWAYLCHPSTSLFCFSVYLDQKQSKASSASSASAASAKESCPLTSMPGFRGDGAEPWGGNATPTAGHQQPQSSLSEQPTPGDICEAGSGSCCRCKSSAVLQKNKRNAAVE